MILFCFFVQAPNPLNVLVLRLPKLQLVPPALSAALLMLPEPSGLTSMVHYMQDIR